MMMAPGSAVRWSQPAAQSGQYDVMAKPPPYLVAVMSILGLTFTKPNE